MGLLSKIFGIEQESKGVPTPQELENELRKVCRTGKIQLIFCGIDEDFFGKDHSKMSESELWEQLVFYIVASGLRSKQISYYLKRIKKAGLLDRKKIRRNPDGSKKKIAQKMYGCHNYKSKADWIVKDAKKLEAGSIKDILESAGNGEEARRKLKREVVGYGLRQSSVFLTSVGYTKELAILDERVTDYMEKIGLKGSYLKWNKDYLELEDVMRDYADGLGFEVSTVTTAIPTTLYNKGYAVLTWLV